MFEVLGFYKFIKIKSLQKNKILLQDFLIKKNIKGTIILANEGINGTISGETKNIKSIINKLKKYFLLKNLIIATNLKVIFNLFISQKLRLRKRWYL